MMSVIDPDTIGKRLIKIGQLHETREKNNIPPYSKPNSDGGLNWAPRIFQFWFHISNIAPRYRHVNMNSVL